MDSRAKHFGHPIHQMLIVFPLGLLATALARDAVALAAGNGYWSDIRRLRSDAPYSPDAAALILSFLGGGLALFTGWLGGELVDRLSVGVDDGAHVDAPSSLTSRRVRE